MEISRYKGLVVKTKPKFIVRAQTHQIGVVGNIIHFFL